VVATRGAEPIVPGGYRTALLLDGEAMLQRPALDAQVDTLTAWEAALSLLAPNAVAYLTDLDGPIAQAVASDAMEKLLVAELAERQALRMPPAIRVASLRGPQRLVEQLTATLTPQAEVDALGPVSVNGEARALIRMPYREAGSIAGELRAAVVRQATESGRRQSKLKVAMDDLATLDELATGDL
jgi:primosomal protein N' (replication factor Y)